MSNENVNVQNSTSPNTENVEKVAKPKHKEKGMFQKKYQQRYLTFVVLIVLLFFYLFTGAVATEWTDLANIAIADYVFIGLNIVILGLANFEILKLVGGTKWPIYVQIITYILIIFLFLFPVESAGHSLSQLNFPFYSLISWEWLHSWVILLVYLFVVLIYLCLIFASKEISFTKMFIVFAFSLYLTFALKGMTKFMLNPSYGWSSVVWLALIIILTDTFAFVGGISYGKHKLAPSISPNKTWEGSVTGTIVGAGAAIAYAILMFQFAPEQNWVFNFFSNDDAQNTMRYVIYVLLGIILSVVSQVGDLSFSWIKRRYGIKDFSNLLPGHGGVLDRLDSFSLVFFVMFIISSIVMA
ncbi:phosphatidate cytidylyltransferase [Spiroplasma syrphidicola EA-1]|uniref:Phosphatidate cytidylyltransferase n=1 Tax=Spiroplasma syrphidicola EA-1 TaxID=1276229 RepID=R4UIE2_9MOLU|nr:phosphatidate cytidylyltransferase [Spiroplasma syrphidicola]AGM25935.1 phosphatidate cytidylyltransferase [Spiroplasma syrphidicola EA-1]